MAKKRSQSVHKKSPTPPDERATLQTMSVAELAAPTEVAAPLWIDRMYMMARIDGVCLMVFEAAIPDQKRRIEVCRLTMTTALAQSMRAVIDKQLDVLLSEDSTVGAD